MIKSLRLGTAASAFAVAAMLTGCAVGPQHQDSPFAAVDKSKIGLATRAQAALESRQYAEAVSLAEQAVQGTPDNAEFRMLLGNCYFAAGRFASAETAYRDSLSLDANQPQVVLKLALVQIAQGKDNEALGYLDLARGALDPADYGLAIALAGRPADAIPVLNQAARQPGADARVRQNLALAYALDGDWTEARTIAAQDVAPGQLDARIQQWMQIAKPAHASDQIAAITGITPAADPGEPTQLALKNVSNPLERLARSAVQQAVAQPAPAPAPAPAMEQQPPVETAEAAAPVVPPQPEVQPAPEALPEPVMAEAARSLVHTAEPVAPPPPTRFDAPPAYVAISDTVRRAAEHARSEGHSRSVVQLGAYSSPQRVEIAWRHITDKYPQLRDYSPMKARYDSAHGMVWRLSISGFGSEREAIARCDVLRAHGGNCFVRTLSGDSPVEIASR